MPTILKASLDLARAQREVERIEREIRPRVWRWRMRRTVGRGPAPLPLLFILGSVSVLWLGIFAGACTILGSR